MIKRIAVAALCLAPLAQAHAAAAPEYPVKPVRIIVGFPAGSGTDMLARFIGGRLTERVQQQIVVDNRPGANGIVATELTAKAAPDGYTLQFMSVSHTMNAAVYDKLPFDPVKSFTPVMQLGAGPLVLVSNPAFAARGVIRALKPGAIFATGSTLGPAPVKKIAAALAARECATLDMPITGGFLAAADGGLVLMVGGDAATLARARPVLQSFAHVITHAGEVGAGQVAKLSHQLVMGLNIMALLEGLALGTTGGVEPALLKQIFGEGLANSNVLEIWDEMGPRWKGMLKSAAAGAPLPNLRKDLHTVLEIARELDVKLHLGAEASRIADAGIATGRDNPLL